MTEEQIAQWMGEVEELLARIPSNYTLSREFSRAQIDKLRKLSGHYKEPSLQCEYCGHRFYEWSEECEDYHKGGTIQVCPKCGRCPTPKATLYTGGTAHD